MQFFSVSINPLLENNVNYADQYLYIRIYCYCLLNLAPVAHFYHYSILFLDNENSRMHCFFISLCLPSEDLHLLFGFK